MMEALEAFAESELEKLGFEGDLSALAKYVSALLSGSDTPVEEQIDKYVQDLEEFLGSNSAPFVTKVVEKYQEIFRKPQDVTKQDQIGEEVEQTHKRVESHARGRFERRTGGRAGKRGGIGSNYYSQRDNSARDSFHVKERKTSLHIRSIPEEKMNVQAIQEYFERFGKVTEVLLLPHHSPCRAIVTFASEKEASEAILCREAVMGDRFIKVYWARKEDFEDKPEGWFERIRANGEVQQQQWKSFGYSEYRPRPFNFRRPVFPSYGSTSLHWSSNSSEQQQNVATKRERENDNTGAVSWLPEKRSKVEQERILNKYLENKRYILQRFESLKDSMKPEQKKAILEELKSLDQNIESCLANISKATTQESNGLVESTGEKTNNE